MKKLISMEIKMNSKFKLDIENDFLECINLTKYHLRLL
jgi:hypothetical protein